MNDLIFGLTFDQIKDMQQGKNVHRVITGSILRPLASDEDIKLFNEIGLDGLKKKGFYGIIDKLQSSGLI